MVTCRGDSCHFPVSGEGWDSTQLGGPSLLTSGSSPIRGCLGSRVIWMGEIHGRCDDDATGGTGSAIGGVTGGRRISS